MARALSARERPQAEHKTQPQIVNTRCKKKYLAYVYQVILTCDQNRSSAVLQHRESKPDPAIRLRGSKMATKHDSD